MNLMQQCHALREEMRNHATPALVIQNFVESQLADLTRQRDEAVRVAEGYLQNANPMACSACAEGICCGSTMHQHEGCIFAERDTLRLQLEAETKARDASGIRKLLTDTVPSASVESSLNQCAVHALRVLTARVAELEAGLSELPADEQPKRRGHTLGAIDEATRDAARSAQPEGGV